ncbi:hypothetical protein NLJ89_g6560 [Agrocybe chaxingu]|uniref:Uncharacterized protein n=1 Tax=Agrocybe chaxingu TaxID=84603 RepID=A0A9W8K0K8_9AGAR|nr:hypothetical protein NLJ89_g6560 [Agrocybe chaxingu]
MPNPGSFQGLRKEFLIGEKAAYAAAVAGGCTKDALAVIQRRFFKRFPVDLLLDEEPTAEHLAAVNDDEPDPDEESPKEDELTPEKYAEAVERLKERRRQIVYRKGQIKRWLAYQYMKDHDVDPKDTGADNPYRVLLHKLTGKGLNRPRQKSSPNAWRKTHTMEIEAETRRRAEKNGVNTKKMAGIREQVAKEMFKALEPSERDEWLERTKEEHEEALKKWDAEVNGPLSMAPEDRQRCILGLTQFVQPILDMICEATGWKATLVAGGPEPAFGGRLTMLSVHSGTTSGEVKMNFGRCEHMRYKKQFIPMYGDFLRKCYTPEHCRACALNTNEEAFDCMANIEHPQQVDIDEIPPVVNRRTSPASGIPPSLVNALASASSAPTTVPTDGAGTACTLPRAPASRAPSPLPSPSPSRCPSHQPSPPVSPPGQTPNAGDNETRPGPTTAD